MATADVTYNFTANTDAAASQVNTNFDDITSFINTNCIQKDGSLAMTGSLTLAGSPTSDTHAATKAYVDQYTWTAQHLTLLAGEYPPTAAILNNTAITDPGYDLQVYGFATILGYTTTLNYWQLYFHVDGVDIGAVIIPQASSGIYQTYAAALPLQTHSTGSDLSVQVRLKRYSGSGANMIVSSDGTYTGGTILYRRHG